MFRKLLELLKFKNIDEPSNFPIINNAIEERTFTETGYFIKANDFELIWVAETVDGKYGKSHCLDDDDYIDYHLWEDINCENLYKKHLPKTILYRGKNPNIIFHGGCLGCLSQRKFGFERCKGCQYFKCNWGYPNLHIKGEEADTMNAESLKRILGKRLRDN